MHSSGPLVGLLIGGLLTVGGWFTAFSIGKPLRDRAVASAAWPVTDGRINRSELERFKDRGKTMYTADVVYEYALDGKTFRGDRVWFGDSARSSDQGVWRRAVERYPKGKVVQVHYDPADPAECVLEPGATWSGSIVYLIGLGFLAIGGLILLSALLPLLFAVAALLAGTGRRPPDPRDDFGGPPPRGGPRGDGGDGGNGGAAGGPPRPSRAAADDEIADDGITIV